MTGIVRGLLGKESKAEKILGRFKPVGFSGGGLSGGFNKDSNKFELTRNAEGNTAVAGLTESFEARKSAFAGLKSRVAPGFGEVTRTTVDAIRRAGSRTVGNLREELSKRRVAGSSFAQREIAGVEAQFGELEAKTRAESKLQELGVTIELTNQETAAATEGATALLKQLNIEGSLAAALGQATSQQIQNNLFAQAQARASSEAGAAEFVASIATAQILKP